MATRKYVWPAGRPVGLYVHLATTTGGAHSSGCVGSAPCWNAYANAPESGLHFTSAAPAAATLFALTSRGASVDSGWETRVATLPPQAAIAAAEPLQTTLTVVSRFSLSRTSVPVAESTLLSSVMIALRPVERADSAASRAAASARTRLAAVCTAGWFGQSGAFSIVATSCRAPVTFCSGFRPSGKEARASGTSTLGFAMRCPSFGTLLG